MDSNYLLSKIEILVHALLYKVKVQKLVSNALKLIDRIQNKTTGYRHDQWCKHLTLRLSLHVTARSIK